VAFALLAVATVGAFFLTQSLKTKNPVVFGNPEPTPAALNPVSGRFCTSRSGQRLDYRETQILVIPSHADSVGVYVVSAADAGGSPVATVTSGVQMKAGGKGRWFMWNGRLSGGQVAPPGSYFFRIVLNNEDRTINLSDAPIQVVRSFPHPRVLSVVLGGGGERTAGTAVLSPPQGRVEIHFTAGAGANGPPRRVWLSVYRTDIPGRPRLVDHFAVPPTQESATWNGEIGGRPAPAGTYLVGITAQDAACDQVSNRRPTLGAGVTIRYLAVTPPLTPVDAGSGALVQVDSPLSGFTWKLRRAGSRKVLAHGSGPSGQVRLDVALPARRAGLYALAVRAGGHSAVVPLVAAATGRRGTTARVLVVLPMLTWIGESSVDGSGDGLPSTLGAGDAVSLDRPLVFGRNGESADDTTLIRDDVALLKYLNARHYGYQLTTDVALAEGVGPSLVDRWGVLLPDGTSYLPSTLSKLLSGFVRYGGRALVLGTRALQGTSKITGYPSDPQASAPQLSSTDLFGAQRGPVSSTGGALIVELEDNLHVFGLLPALTGFSSYQPIEPPAGVLFSAAGIATGSPAVSAFTVGKGTAIEVGLPDFGASLAGNVDSQELLDSVWPLLAKQG
jgi:hypothetical protein